MQLSQLRDGKLAVCPTVCYGFYYDNYHKDGRGSKLSKRGLIDLYGITSFEELDKRLNTPCELCDYCVFYTAAYDETKVEK